MAARLEKVALCCANAGHLAHRSLGQVVGQQLALVGPRHQHVVLQRKKKKEQKTRQTGRWTGRWANIQADRRKEGRTSKESAKEKTKKTKKTNSEN